MTFAVPWLLPTAAELLSLVRHFTATLRTAFQLGTGAPSTVKRSMYALGTADRQPGLRSENVTHLSKNEAEVHVGPQAKHILVQLRAILKQRRCTSGHDGDNPSSMVDPMDEPGLTQHTSSSWTHQHTTMLLAVQVFAWLLALA
jgi:hypothetical protein